MCKGTNPTGSTTSTGTSGVPVKSIGVVPTMFLFQPDGENIKYDDFESIRLWVINHIDDFYVNPYGKNTNWIKNGMNFEGCLVKLKKGKPWASLPEINGKKYQVYFTSIPLNPADVDLVCNGLGTHNNDELTASRKDIKRPYPDDPASVSLRQNDIPAKLRNDPKLLAKDHDITYDSSKRLLSSAPTMPEKVKDELIKFPGTNRTFKAAVKALHTGSNLKEFKNIWVIEIPEAKLFRAANIKKLTYWETLMYQENTTPALEKYRKLQRQRLFTEKHYKELRLLLRDIRGNFVFYYNSNLKPSMPHKDGPPKVVYDNRTHSLTGLGWPKEAMEKGPFWICSESEDAREGVDKGEEKVEEEDTGGTKVLLHKLDTKFTPLPKPIPLLPSVDHKVINLIKTETKNLVKNLYKTTTEKQLLESIRAVLKTEGKYSEVESRFISGFFYISEADTGNMCLMNALSAMVKHMQIRSESRFLDIMKEMPKSTAVVQKNLIVGFATGCDAFSESPSPKHVYIQLKEWWNNLCETEREEIKKSYEIEIRGYSSPLGEKTQINIDLRSDRAWKIAKSLKILLGKDINIKMNENKESPGGDPPDPKKRIDPVNLYFCGEKKRVFPTKDLKHLYAPIGSMLCDVYDDSQAIKSAVKGLPPDNDPRDRIGWIIFRKSELREYIQFVKETGRHNSAGAVSAYRILWFVQFQTKSGSTQYRTLLYAIPGMWK